MCPIKTIPELNVAERSIIESELLNGIENMQTDQPRHPYDDKANTTAIQQKQNYSTNVNIQSHQARVK